MNIPSSCYANNMQKMEFVKAHLADVERPSHSFRVASIALSCEELGRQPGAVVTIEPRVAI
jgi:hypothetical protein